MWLCIILCSPSRKTVFAKRSTDYNRSRRSFLEQFPLNCEDVRWVNIVLLLLFISYL